MEHLSWYSTKPRWGKSNSHAWVPSVMRPPQSPSFSPPTKLFPLLSQEKKVSQKFFLPQQAVSYALGQRVIPPAELGGRSRPRTLQTEFPLSSRRKPQGSLEDALKIDPLSTFRGDLCREPFPSPPTSQEGLRRERPLSMRPCTVSSFIFPRGRGGRVLGPANEGCKTSLWRRVPPKKGGEIGDL